MNTLAATTKMQLLWHSVSGPVALLTPPHKMGSTSMQGSFIQNNQYGCQGNNAKQNRDIPLCASEKQLCNRWCLSAPLPTQKHKIIKQGQLFKMTHIWYIRLTTAVSHTLCVMIHTCKWHNEHLVNLGSTYLYIYKNIVKKC